MCKRFYCFLISIFSLLTTRAQVSVSLHEPSGIVQKAQLWSITLIWSGRAPVSITIGLSLFDANDNHPILTAFTRPIALVNGVKQLSASDVEPVDYNYLSPTIDLSRLPNGFLPVGNYRACYTVYQGLRHSEVLSEDCTNFVVDPVAPPQLNLPADSAKLETHYPQFTWLPPAPVILFNDLNYDLLVTEVQDGQSPYDAIQENLPIYSALHVTSVVNNYPASNKSLDTGKVYAWRVIAKNGETFSAQSEVWTFSVAQRKPEQLTPVNGIYFELKSESNYVNLGVIPNNILGVKYYSYDQTHDALIQFLDDRGRVIQEITKTIQYGNNFLVFKLDHQFSEGKIYSIQLRDLQLLHYKASFKISKQN